MDRAPDALRPASADHADRLAAAEARVRVEQNRHNFIGIDRIAVVAPESAAPVRPHVFPGL